MSSPSWEFKVIHINVEDKSGKAPEAPASPEPAPPTGPIFSETYLRQEFPQHYAQQQAQQHPAVQLQSFLNSQGQEGWDFVGCFPLGSLTMMFFRRPLPAPVVLPPSPPPAAPAPPQPEPTSVLERLQQGLDAVLRRLDALEASGLQGVQPERPSASPSSASPSSASSSSAAAPPPPRRVAASPQRRPQVLSLDQRNQLPPGQAVPTTRAAELMGFRSYASLLGYGAKHGYRPGLVKPGPNGFSAVYLGLERRAGGGKALRLWRVLPSDALPSPD